MIDLSKKVWRRFFGDTKWKKSVRKLMEKTYYGEPIKKKKKI